ncbi:hypothetical protein ACFQ4O_06415 [Methylopila musalis]|uniref:Uncharacterized protein n=1 Tax=Methylopila musalis TaxID=1134781 RepID=A0ABW3Z5Y6_9HYPH
MRALGALVLATLVAFGAGAAQAASPDAWKAHAAEVAKACAGASRLAKATPRGTAAEFEAHSALVLDGRVASGRRKGTPERVACLFDKRARKAATTPVEGW